MTAPWAVRRQTTRYSWPHSRQNASGSRIFPPDAGERHLVVAGESPPGLVLQCRVDRVALGQELVQPEREQRPAGLRVPWPSTRPAASGAVALSHWPGSVLVCAASSAATSVTVTGARRASFPSSSRSSPKLGLDPGGQRVGHEVLVADGRGGREDPLRGHRPRLLGGRPDEGLPDHPLRRDRRPEDGGRDVRDILAALRRGALDWTSSPRCRCTARQAAAQASLTRRTSSATSAPCRPR